MVGIINQLQLTETFKLPHYRGHGLLEVQSMGHGSEKIENYWSKLSMDRVWF